MQTKTISQLLRKRTEEWKSFPIAVAALIEDAVRRGATRVYVQVGNNDVLYVRDNGSAVRDDTLRCLFEDAATWAPSPNPMFGFVHHAASVHVKTMTTSILFGLDWPAPGSDGGTVEMPALGSVGFNVCTPGVTHMVEWKGLGDGDGVNAGQVRTAARLANRLAAHLSRDTVRMVTILNEGGKHLEIKIGKEADTIGPFSSVLHFGGVKFEIIGTRFAQPEAKPGYFQRMRGGRRKPANIISVNLSHPDFAGNDESRDRAIRHFVAMMLAKEVARL